MNSNRFLDRLQLPEQNERFSFYRFPNGTHVIDITGSQRNGVFKLIPETDRWEYDAQLSAAFRWDKPFGDYCAFLPESVNMRLRLYAFLWVSELLFEENNCIRYAPSGRDDRPADNRDAQPLPHYPGRNSGLTDEYAEPACSFLRTVGEYLRKHKTDLYPNLPPYPGLEESMARISSLDFGKCANALMLYNSLLIEDERQLFFSWWGDGSALRLIQRMKALLEADRIFETTQMNENTDSVQAGSDKGRNETAVPQKAAAGPGKSIDRQVIRSKILACLNAGALGDALGYVVEFDSWEAIRKKYGKNGIRDLVISGEKAIISDDTQMTLFTAEGLGYGFFRAAEKGISAHAEYYIHQSYLCWYLTQGGNAQSLWEPVSRLLYIPEMRKCRAPGTTCLRSLGSGKMGTIEDPINNSKGCGGVMRTAPAGFLRKIWSGTRVFGPALEIGARAAAITHGHPMGWIPAGMLSDIIDRCIYGQYGTLYDIVMDSLSATANAYGRYDGFPEFEGLIRRAITLAQKNKARGSVEKDVAAVTSLGGGWVGDEALAIAVYCALRWDDDLKNCLCAAVNHSGDSDSTGAIAGNILGAFLGSDAIPRDWLDNLELTETIEWIADMMMQVIEYY